jgi:hypothetical protein
MLILQALTWPLGELAEDEQRCTAGRKRRKKLPYSFYGYVCKAQHVKSICTYLEKLRLICIIKIFYECR